MFAAQARHDGNEMKVKTMKAKIQGSSETKQEGVRRRTNAFQAAKQNGKLHKAVQKVLNTELGMAAKVIEEAIANYPGQVNGQIDYVYDNQEFIALTGRKRPIGETSLGDYRKRTKIFFRMKEKLNMRAKSIKEITPKQVRAVFDEMKVQGRSQSYITSMNTTMRRFGVWLGLPDLCPPCSYLFDDKDVYTRKIAATQRKDWGDDEEEIEKTIQEVSKECQVVGCILRLAWNFGLRVKEGLEMIPKESIRGDVLFVIRGTKGGKARMVDIETQEQREVLALALEISSNNKEGLMLHKRGITLVQAQSHFQYIMRKSDLTRKGKGKTAHGLRHQFANDQFEFKTKHKSPVRGGGLVDREVLVDAKREISGMLGHSRESITAAYIGNLRHLSRTAIANVKKLIQKLEGDEQMKELSKQLGAAAIYVCGGHADGDPVTPNSMVLLSADMGEKSIPQDLEMRITRHAQQILDCKLVAFCKNESLSVNASRLALLGLAAGVISGQVN